MEIVGVVANVTKMYKKNQIDDQSEFFTMAFVKKNLLHTCESMCISVTILSFIAIIPNSFDSVEISASAIA